MTIESDYWEAGGKFELEANLALDRAIESKRKVKHMEDYFKELDKRRAGEPIVAPASLTLYESILIGV